MIGWLLRRLWCSFEGATPCLAYRCGRSTIHSPSQWCRLHTDAILYQRGDEGHHFEWRQEVAARMGHLTDVELERLALEIDIGRDMRVWRHL